MLREEMQHLVKTKGWAVLKGWIEELGDNAKRVLANGKDESVYRAQGQLKFYMTINKGMDTALNFRKKEKEDV